MKKFKKTELKIKDHIKIKKILLEKLILKYKKFGLLLNNNLGYIKFDFDDLDINNIRKNWLIIYLEKKGKINQNRIELPISSIFKLDLFNKELIDGKFMLVSVNIIYDGIFLIKDEIIEYI